MCGRADLPVAVNRVAQPSDADERGEKGQASYGLIRQEGALRTAAESSTKQQLVANLTVLTAAGTVTEAFL